MSEEVNEWNLEDESCLLGNDPISLKTFYSISKYCKPSIFQIRPPSGDHVGSGCLCKLKLGSSDQPRYGLLTCNHVLRLAEPQLIEGSRLYFAGIQSDQPGNLAHITLERRHFGEIIRTDRFLDLTFVEINLWTAAEWQKSFRFLELARHLNDKRVLLFQYSSDSKELLFHMGRITEDSSGHRLFHTASTKPGASGAPLINWEMEIVGVHRKGGRTINLATNIQFFIEFLIPPTLEFGMLADGFFREADDNVDEDLHFSNETYTINRDLGLQGAKLNLITCSESDHTKFHIWLLQTKPFCLWTVQDRNPFEELDPFEERKLDKHKWHIISMVRDDSYQHVAEWDNNKKWCQVIKNIRAHLLRSIKECGADVTQGKNISI